MDEKTKAALERLAKIEDQTEQGLFGYAGAVFEVYGHLPEKQLYEDTQTLREFLATQQT